MSALLSIRDLAASFAARRGAISALQGASLQVHAGRMVGLIGESGSGKTVLAHAVMGILPDTARITAGQVLFQGQDVLTMPPAQREAWRGREAAIIFQDPRAALNPIRTIGAQIADVIARHLPGSAAQVRARTIDALRQVRIPDPEQRLAAYPHQLSGGMCQRVGIAAALACGPSLLIADEPTTGLDVTTQAAVMSLIRDIAKARGMGVLLITHDIALAAQYCDDLAVMQNGRVIEAGQTDTVITSASAAYTQSLLRAVPAAATYLHDLQPGPATQPPRASSPQSKLMDARDLSMAFPVGPRLPWRKRNFLHAVDHVDLRIAPGEALGIVGESGGGKSTLARMIARLTDPTSGSLTLDGQDITAISKAAFGRHPLRRQVQMVFQDPGGSLAPHLTAFDLIAHPLRRFLGLHRDELTRRVHDSAAAADLPLDLLDRYPHQLSQGQKARVGIARAIAPDPRLLILDEPTSALDPPVQARVLILLDRLRRERGLAMIFVSHDLSVVRLMCQRIAVMYLGQIVEDAPTDVLYGAPKHPYTQALLAAVPRLDRKPATPALQGEPQSPINPSPSHCRLVGRCPVEQPLCRTAAPALRDLGAGRWLRCHFG